MSAFDFMKKPDDQQGKLETMFGKGDSFGSPPKAGPLSGAPPASQSAAVPGAVSPAADTVVDSEEKDTYLSNKASMDSKWANDPLLARAMARQRGEKLEDPEIKPELGAPKQSRPLADPADVIAGVMATANQPAAKEPSAGTGPAEAPSTGPSEKNIYEANRASFDAKHKDDDWLQQALERHKARKAGSSE